MSTPSSNNPIATEFRIEDREIDSSTQLIEVAGDVDLYSAPDLKKAVSSAIEGGKTRLIIDLAGATFIDSTTLGVLVGARKRLRTRSGALAVVCPDADKMSLFEMTGLDRVFSIHAGRDEALAAVRAGEGAAT